MASMKNVLAAIGLITIMAFAGICVALMASSVDDTHNMDPVTYSDANTDGLTKEEIQKKLQHYADVLNANDGKTHYLIVSGLVKTSTRDYSSITSESMIRISPGSAKVIDGDLVINVTESTSYHSNVTKYSCEYTIPYHAITGIKIYESLSS